MASGVLVDAGKVFIQKRQSPGVWAGLWEFPGGSLESGETPEQALIREYMEETEVSIEIQKKIRTLKHNYTKYKVTLHCYYVVPEESDYTIVLHEADDCKWITPDMLDSFAFPAGHRKVIDTIRRDPFFSALLHNRS